MSWFDLVQAFRRLDRRILLAFKILSSTLVICSTASYSTDYPTALLPSLNWHAPAPTSAWFVPGGFLRLDLQQDGLQSRYEIPMDLVDNTHFACDETEFFDAPMELNGSQAAQGLCINRIVLAAAFFGNLAIQDHILNHEDVSPDLERSLEESYRELEGIRGRRVLVVGDSIDRFWLDFIARKYGHLGTTRSMEYTGELYDDWFKGNYFAKSAIIPLLPNVDAVRAYHQQPHPYIQKYDNTHGLHPDTIRFDLVFAPGMLETDEIDFNLDGTKPSSTTRRLELSADMWGGHANEPWAYDMITLNFGVWDLFKLNYRNFVAFGRDTFVGLETAWVRDYIEQGRYYVARVRSLWGRNTPVFFRPTTDVDWARDVSNQPKDLPEGTPRDQAFTELRFQQLRDAQNVLMRREGLSSVPFAQLMRGQTTGALSDGLHPGDNANKLYMELFFRRLKGTPAR